MNKIFFVLLALFIPGTLLAQDADWGAIRQTLDARPFAGKRFKVEASVKVHLIDPQAHAEIWVRVDKKNGRMGFFDNMEDRPVRSDKWKVVTIEGRIDKSADSISFGGVYTKKGTFYFDQFRFLVETPAGKLEEIPIANSGFEDAGITPSWRYFKKTEGFNFSVTADEFYEGKQAAKVNGTRLAAISYGSNDSVGKYAEVNGISLYYETYGTGEPLLLWHGNSQSIEAFKLQIPELSKHFRVIAIDTRGQGKSTNDGKTYTYDLFAEDMNALLDYLHLDSVRILGWSDGGNTGLIMAMK